MNAIASTPGASGPGSLPSSALARRLADLCGEERNVQVDFLLHLDEFDRRRAWAEAGYGSLWVYCLEVLHLRESAAGRTDRGDEGAPAVPFARGAAPGRAAVLLHRQPARAGADRGEPDRPRRAGGVPVEGRHGAARGLHPASRRAEGWDPADQPRTRPPRRHAACRPQLRRLGSPRRRLRARRARRYRRPRAPRSGPISAETYSVRVTIDAACKAELDQLVALLSHKTGGDLAEVLREAIRCGIAKHGKRKGAVEPERKRSTPAGPLSGRPARDPDGGPASGLEARRRLLRLDLAGRQALREPVEARARAHRPVALGGPATVDEPPDRMRERTTPRGRAGSSGASTWRPTWVDLLLLAGVTIRESHVAPPPPGPTVLPSPAWRPGTPSSSAEATTASSSRPTSPARASASSCSRRATASAAPARPRRPGPGSRSPPPPTS